MWLSDLRIVLPDGILDQGALRIEDGIIAEIVEGPGPVDTPSMAGLTLVPGFVDLHGDMLERDVQPRPGARFPTPMGLIELDKRLAGAGITTAYAAVSFAWKQDDIRSQASATEIIDTIHARRDSLLIDMRVHGRFEVTNPQTAPILEDLLTAGKVQLVSIMDHTPGQGQYGDIERYIGFIHQWLGFDLESVGDLKERLMTALQSRAETLTTKPRDWSVVRQVLDVARRYGVPVASHDDDTPQKVAEQAAMGVTISEFPVNEQAARAARAHGMTVVMGAPNAYRGQSTSDNLSAADAIRTGLVDALATDYYPAAMLHAMCKFGHGEMPMHEAVKLVSTNPADAVGLTDRGRIAVGQRADLVLVEDGDYPRVRATFVAGVPVFRDSSIVAL